MSAIQEAIMAAEIAAGKIVEERALDETLQATASANKIELMLSYTKPSLASLGNNSVIAGRVSSWLKVDAFGMSIGSDKKKFDSLVFTIDMIEDKGFYVKESIKWGDPVCYASRYSGTMSDKGEAWAEVVARARRITPKANVYASADIVLTTTGEIELKDRVTKIPKGAKLGLVLSMSNWRGFENFCRDVSLSGRLGTTVTVELTPEEVISRAGQSYGVFNFKLIE